jgi:tetratricopeptide (TPR) repeat protein
MRLANVAMGGLLTSLLAACQTLDPGKEASLSVVPVQGVRHGISKPEALYAIGRYQQGQMRYDEAIATYRRLLDAHPQHAEARNALGLTLAAQGKYDQAVVEFETAMANAPGMVSIRNNLGYAHLLQGNVAQALAVLEVARTLDPSNQRVLDNLEIAMSDVRTKANPGPVVAIKTNAVHAVVPSAKPSIEATITMPMDVVPKPAAEVVEQPVRLEISNGNGITRMARDTAHELAGAGYARPRLTNVPPYQLPTTEIQYRPGFEAQALRLRETLRSDIPVAPSTMLRWDIQLRLALGKDVQSAQELMAQKAYAQR